MLATDKQQEQMWFFWLGVPLHLGGPDSARISFLEKCIPRNRKQAGAPFRSKLKLVTHNSFQNKQMAGIGLGRKRSTVTQFLQSAYLSWNSSTMICNLYKYLSLLALITPAKESHLQLYWFKIRIK